MIGDEIEVTVLAVSRDKIRLGITAPKDVPVYRKEVYLSIKGEAGPAGEGGREDVAEALEGLGSD
ncbi:MAG: carbon storage regulator [Actinomycetota bacterium]|nr:carbon storage regulator [Actinomycetota bacterium]